MANLGNKMLSNCNKIVYYDLKEKLIKRQIQSNILQILHKNKKNYDDSINNILLNNIIMFYQ